MHVGDAPLDEGVGRLALAAALANLPIELAGFRVVAEIVERHHQVQLRLGVVGVEHQRALEPVAREHEVAHAVRDHAEHVEDVGKPIGVLGDLAQQGLGLVVLALGVVLAAEEQELFDMVVHGLSSSKRSNEPKIEPGRQ